MSSTLRIQMGKADPHATRAQLAGVIAILGPPPLDSLEKGSKSKKFFDSEVMSISAISVDDGERRRC